MLPYHRSGPAHGSTPATAPQAIDEDFRRGTLLREDILIHAFQYYTGEMEDEDADDEEDDDEDDDEGDDDDDDDDDGDDDDDEDKPPPKLAPGSGKPGEQECKQQ
jgi:hypothetical protein